MAKPPLLLPVLSILVFSLTGVKGRACGMCASLGFGDVVVHDLSGGPGDGASGGSVLFPAGEAESQLGSFGITISPGSGLAGNAPALQAFQRAASTWASFIADPIQITINADFADLGNPLIIGQASSVLLQAGYDTIRNALAATNPAEPLLQALPTSAQFSALFPQSLTLGNLIVLTKANAKAFEQFGDLDAAFGVSDGSITFNSSFAFDFDRSDGIGTGLIDFESVALHEIGHALGFVSSVDTIDALLAASQTGTVSPMLMDLFRFQDGGPWDPSNLAEFTTFPRFLGTGGSAVFDTLAQEWALSTGRLTGNGSQASHWIDGAPLVQSIGVMDPTLSAGQVFNVTAADLRVLSLLGYNIVIPEPSASLAVLLGAVILCARRRRDAQTVHEAISSSAR